jgi:hypothetical protein
MALSPSQGLRACPARTGLACLSGTMRRNMMRHRDIVKAKLN